MGGDVTRAPEGRRIGVAFLSYAAAILLLLALAMIEIGSGAGLAPGTASNLGIMAATVYCLAGFLAAYRAAKSGLKVAWAIAPGMVGPGAVWCWIVFVGPGGDGGVPRAVAVAVAALAAGLAMALLVEGRRLARPLEVFTGLGALVLVLITGLLLIDPVASASVATSLLAAVGGMAALWGGLVDLEEAEQRSLSELIESRRHIEEEVARTEDVFHDLRSGLLAIEAAAGAFDDEVAEPLRLEAARLRRLTMRGQRTVEVFDLVERVTYLVRARRAAGAPVDLRAPASAPVWGEESEVLSIVDNLLSNAERHGGSAPIEVEILQVQGRTSVVVTDLGPGVADAEVIFERGVTSHPDGRGIGLSRARMLATLNGAELGLRPSPQGATSFVLDLRSEPPVAAV